MPFLIITHAEHYISPKGELSAYAPYVREMNIWLKHVEKVIIVAPKAKAFDEQINLGYNHPNIKYIEVPAFSLLGFQNCLRTLLVLPKITFTVFKAMKNASHIHLRCPGNMGLIGCVLQVFFPNKKKTAKYAGNWDYNSKQAWSYRLQQFLLNSTLLTKQMTALVYGHWPGVSKNIKSFFTATYRENEKQVNLLRNYTTALHFCFVGSLTTNKGIFETLDIVQQLKYLKYEVVLHFYGDGKDKAKLIDKIKAYKAEKWVFVYGNQPKQQIKKALQYSHFLLLPSKSEGWPKAIAEAMFWGCIPIATKVSCVPWMLDNGKRGILLGDDFDNNIKLITSYINDYEKLEQLSEKGSKWSRQYTLDNFEKEIKQLL